ncbi:MAG: hypothetical protein IKK29_04235 [Christensenellaceae bacterium]|nr:hypothetical protein [Christensenellaceae bacterium]
MEKFYEKLKEMSEDKFIKLQWIVGTLSGIVCWIALRASSFSGEQILSYLFIAVFLVVVLGTRSISRKIERPLTKFSFGMAIGLGVCIVIFAVCAFIISDPSSRRGLIEMVFNIPV